MSEIDVLPELKEVVGTLLFAAKSPLSVDEILRVIRQTAEKEGGMAADYGEAARGQVEEAVNALRRQISEAHVGFQLCEVGGGFRFENIPACGPWVRQLLDKGRSKGLSVPALETLAIVAYRQPCTRAQIEEVRGVAVDQILRNLLELQLVRIAGRSPLPGRPWLFGTTQHFLEHFGLRSLDDLPSREDLSRFHVEKKESEKRDESLEDGE
jgi:segregation and condensation protein B